MDARSIFGYLGCVTAFITFLPPAWELYKLWWQGRSPEQSYSAVPYHAAIINCALWVMYGHLHKEILLGIIFNVGFFMAMAYLFLYILFSHAFMNAMKHGIIFLIELSSLFVLSRVALTSNDPATFAGIACATGSTFCVVKMMYGNNRVDRASFLDSLALFVNGIIWIIYSIISVDQYILLPNMVWALVGMVHLAQYAVRHGSAVPRIGGEEEMTSLCLRSKSAELGSGT